jgi:CDP-diacylglycerol--glycerol-3-phosphate 3-phosphatidyltransferase
MTTTPVSPWLSRLPNQLTFFRAASTPLIIFLMIQGQMAEKILDTPPKFYDITAGVLFGISALTDFFDGWLARRYQIESVIGKLLDPLADKILTVSSLIMLVEKHRLAGWFVVLLVIRDLGITSIRVKALEDGFIMHSHLTGKLKTVFLDIGITALILYGNINPWISFKTLGLIAVGFAWIFSFHSAYLYLIQYYKALMRKEKLR